MPESWKCGCIDRGLTTAMCGTHGMRTPTFSPSGRMDIPIRFPGLICISAIAREIRSNVCPMRWTLLLRSRSWSNNRWLTCSTFFYLHYLMKTVATNEAKTHLSSLLQEVSEGETVVISRGRKPLAKLVPFDLPVVRPRVGEMLDKPFSVSEEALQPMRKEELRSWGL